MRKFVVLFAVCAVLGGCGKHFTTTGVVVEKSYTASSVGTGVGPSTGGDGGVAVVITSTPESYVLFVKFADGQVDHFETGKTFWVKAQRGDTVTLSCNTIWGCDINEH